MAISYWVWLGTIYLMILTYKDFKNNMNVDDRHNHFMLGVSISLISHFKHSVWYLLGVAAISVAIYYFINKNKVLGAADAKTISWIFLGFGYIDPGYLAWFCAFFFGIMGIYWIIKSKVFKIKQPTPFYIVILFSFVLTCFMFGLYL